MSEQQRIVIVGGGLSGVRTAEVLRDEGFEGAITVLALEKHLPYDRPPLSKGYLKGETPREEVTLHPEQWYQERDIDLRLGTGVTSIERDDHQVVLTDGSRLPYGKLVLATGSSPRRLDLPGGKLGGVVYLRTVDDSDRLKQALERVADGRLQNVVLVGGGWIGLEVASAFRDAGAEVTVLEAADRPLGAILGPEVAQSFVDLHRDHGVDVRTGVQVKEFAPAEGTQRVGSVVLADGSSVPADLVVVGVGAAPNTGLAEKAGLEVDGGIVADAQGRTSDPDVFAVGDISKHVNTVVGGPVRVEHWAMALNQPLSVVRGLLGRDGGDDLPPFFYSDQYDLGLEYAGHASADDEVVVRGDLAAREYVAFWLRDDRLIAGMNVNVWDVTDDIQKLIVDRTPVDRTKLADPGVPILDTGV